MFDVRTNKQRNKTRKTYVSNREETPAAKEDPVC